MLKKVFVTGLLVTLVNVFVCPITLAKDLVLDPGTPINLIVNSQLSSKDSVVGQRVDMSIADDVTVNDAVVIPKGSKVKGTVSSVESKTYFGTNGRVGIQLTSINLASGKIIPVSNVVEKHATDRFDPDSNKFIPIVVASVLFLPISLLFVAPRGKDTIVPAGSIVPIKTDRELVFSN
ncbi:MAG: hypothetical protein WCG23_11280 [bacterium]